MISLPALDALPDVPVEIINDARSRHARVSVELVRLDRLGSRLSGDKQLVHDSQVVHDQHLGGNKWFKLLPFLHAARQRGQRTVLSFGGAYSNHIGALAAAGRHYGFHTIGVIRGELIVPLNPVLHFATRCGMSLHPMTRAEYRRRNEPGFAEHLCHEWGLGPNVCIIPEGGAELIGVEGCQRLAQLLWPLLQAPLSPFSQFSPPLSSPLSPPLLSPQLGPQPCEIVLPCGTGTTAAGLIAGLHKQLLASASKPDVRVRGVAVMKGGEFLRDEIRTWLARQGVTECAVPWKLETAFHAGGYARATPALRAFIDDFEQRHKVPLEPVYSGKLLHAVFQRIEQGRYAPGTRIVALHTGGIWPAVR